MDFNIYELKVKVYTKNSFAFKYALCEIRDLIDTALIADSHFKEFHNLNSSKCPNKYVFDKLYPFNLETQVYEASKLYDFKLRTSNQELAKYLLETLENTSTKNLKGIETRLKRLSTDRIIEKIYTLTSAVVSTKDKSYWRKSEDLSFFENRIISNTDKKLCSSAKENHRFFSSIEFRNRIVNKAIVKRVNGKDIVYPADLVTLNINADKKSQEMAWKVIADGLLEKNSRGFGFLGFKCY